jgi:hypothetical protein
VRIERKGDLVTLRLVVLDGIRDERPGLVAVDRQRKLTNDEWEELVRRVAKSGFWSLGKDKEVVELLDIDRDVIEGLKDGHHHVVARYSRNRYECSDLWDYMLALTRFEAQ